MFLFQLVEVGFKVFVPSSNLHFFLILCHLRYMGKIRALFPFISLALKRERVTMVALQRSEEISWQESSIFKRLETRQEIFH